MRRSLVHIAFLVLLAAIALPAAAAPAQKKPGGSVDIQLLAINDFHGNLEGPSGTIRVSNGPPAVNVPAGGVDFLAAHIQALEATNPNTAVVAAGDLIGASPLISALFHDEPAIEAMNLLGLDYASVGNHEFDEGSDELLRMQNGGCHPVDGCQDGDGFAGAEFQYLSANVFVHKDHGHEHTLFPAYRIKQFGGPGAHGVKVAFIGLTLEGTPTIVTPSGVAGLDFEDEADTVNSLIPELRRRGVETIVVLIHEGGVQTGLYNQCNGISGAIVDIVHRLDPAVDLVVSGHTHQAYNCVIDGRIVTSASSFGRVLTKIDLTVDVGTGDVTAMQADNLVVTRDVTPDAAEQALIQKYKSLSDPLANRVIGTITADITRTTNAAGESALGDVIADAQLAATAPAGLGNAVAAFMNPGGIRIDLLFSQISGGEAPGAVTYGEAFAVQPFGNSLVTMDLTGAQIDAVLEQQFNNPTSGQNRILQVSNGFTYSWSASAPIGSRVDPTSIKINGVTVNPAATYRVTVNSFLADGGDNFTVLQQGTNRLGGAVDLDALVDYFGANSPVAPGPQNRITRNP